MADPYLLKANDRFYPYRNRELLLICLAENRREGFEPQAVFKLVPEGYGYAYTPTTEEDIKAERTLAQDLGESILIARQRKNA